MLDAKASLNGEEWDYDRNGEVAVGVEDEEELLGPEEARQYRGVAARLTLLRRTGPT